MENNGFWDFSPNGSWEALDVLKRLSEGVRTFSAIENFILRIFPQTVLPLMVPSGIRPWTRPLISVAVYRKIYISEQLLHFS